MFILVINIDSYIFAKLY